MPFLKTAKTHGHDHAVLFDPSTGAGTTSFDADHFHNLAPSATPGAPPTIEPAATPDGHTHEILSSLPKRLDPNPEAPEIEGAPATIDGDGGTLIARLNEAETVNRVGQLYSHAYELELDSVENGMEDERYHRGDSWPEEAKDDPDTDMIVVNELESKVDLLCGYLAQNKTDFKFFPIESGDLPVTELLDTVTKVDFVDAYNYHREEAAVFEDACITGRGLFNCRMDFSRHPDGNLVIEQYPWNAVRFGPHLHSDLRDCEYLVKFKWMSLARLSVLYPDAAEKLRDVELNMNLLSAGVSARALTMEATDPYSMTDASSNSTSPTLPDPTGGAPFSANDIEPRRRMVLVYELWEKEYVRKTEFLTPTGERLDVTGWKDRDIEQFAALPGIETSQTDAVRMRVTVVAGGKLLQTGFPDLPFQGFHIVPVYAKKRGHHFWSKIRAGRDLQLVINKRFVQAVDEVNRAASGWLIDDQCFTSKQQRANFENAVSRAQFVAEVKDLSHKPEKISPGTNIAALEELINLSSQKLREVLGINPEMMGINSKAESGIAIFQKQRQGLLGNVFLFESLSAAKQVLGRIILHYIQALYTPARILRILKNAKARRKLLDTRPAPTAAFGGGAGQPGAAAPAMAPAPGVPMDPMSAPPNGGAAEDSGEIFGLTEADIAEFLRTFDASRYDVIVGEAKENPTTRLTWFQIWNDYAMTHPDLPAEFLLAMSDTPEKDRLFAILEEARARAQQAELASRQASTATPSPRRSSPAPALPEPGQQPNNPLAALPGPSPTANPSAIDAATAAGAVPPETGILTP